ncbi:sulfatase, partial [Halobacteriales archaeon SW_12_67_38]
RNWVRAIRHDGAKYVEYPDRAWSAECYDLDADPQELVPIETDRLASRLQRRLPTDELDDAERLDIDDRLRDLGYL